MKVKLGISNRHIHLNKETCDLLFGEDYKLTIKNNLLQPGEYSANETLTIKTNKDEIRNVRIIGPLRPYSQVEISKTDSYKLGINPPLRDSNNLIDSEDITLISNLKEVKLTNACVISTRHIHMNNIDALKYGLKNNDKVSIKVEGIKPGILGNVNIKVKDNYVLELHLDTDDANAFLLNNNDELEVII
ncbi:MAG: phosphate propanoyltransferase [Bacilli bacterium]